MGRICKKEGFKSGIKERVGDEKLIIISVAVRGIIPRPFLPKTAIVDVEPQA